MAAAKVRTRFSPSPTGELHAGGLRTALFNYLRARAAQGTFILRIEDTDTARSTREYEEQIIEELESFGLISDEGPNKDGQYGPYRQSERTDLYTERALGLIESGHAYRCYCSPERLAELKAADVKAGRPPRYDGKCADLKSKNQSADNGDISASVIRFRVPKKTIRFFDSVHGEMSFESSAFGDFVLIGSDGTASYNFAATLDDALMNITDVIRGDDHLPNTPRQILLYEAMGFIIPKFTHLPLVLAPDGSPLSKRHSHFSIRALRKEGFLDSAILNTTVRLGWSPTTDGSAQLMSLQEMVERFAEKKDGGGSRLSKSPSLFDPAHLSAFNRLAIADMSADELSQRIKLNGDSETACTKADAIEAVKRNCATLKEVAELARPLLYNDITPTDTAIAALKEESAVSVLALFSKSIEESKEEIIEPEQYKATVERVKQESGAKGRKLFLPIRCALTGRTDGIELEKIVQRLGKETIIKRLTAAL